MKNILKSNSYASFVMLHQKPLSNVSNSFLGIMVVISEDNILGKWHTQILQILPRELVSFACDFEIKRKRGTIKNHTFQWPGKTESEKLVCLAPYAPKEFARKPRSLEEVDRWKAIEFRQFLLYTGPFVLRSVLLNNLYKHFMCLSVAITILVKEQLAVYYSNYASPLLSLFVKNCRKFYWE